MAFSLFKVIKGLLIKEENSLNPKQIQITPGGTAGTTTTVVSSQTTDKTITIPDATDTLVGKATTDTLTNKTINSAGSGNTINVSAVGVIATELNDALAEIQTNVDNHLNDTTGAHAASAISNTPSGNVSSTTVQAAVDELQSDIDTRALNSDLTAHITDATDAHAASAISNTPAGNLAATTVQAALNELDSEKTKLDLSNLASTAVNVDIVPASADSIKLGSASNYYSDTFSKNVKANTLGTVSGSGSITLNSSLLGGSGTEVKAASLTTHSMSLLDSTLATELISESVGTLVLSNSGSYIDLDSNLSINTSIYDAMIVEFRVVNPAMSFAKVGQFYLSAYSTTVSGTEVSSETSPSAAGSFTLESAYNSGTASVQYQALGAPTSAIKFTYKVKKFKKQ